MSTCVLHCTPLHSRARCVHFYVRLCRDRLGRVVGLAWFCCVWVGLGWVARCKRVERWSTACVCVGSWQQLRRRRRRRRRSFVCLFVCCRRCRCRRSSSSLLCDRWSSPSFLTRCPSFSLLNRNLRFVRISCGASWDQRLRECRFGSRRGCVDARGT